MTLARNRDLPGEGLPQSAEPAVPPSPCPDPPESVARVDRLLHEANPQVYESLRPDQVALIRRVFGGAGSGRHHVDVRGTLPLFFARYYFVFQLGRDRRRETRRTESERRRRAALTSALLAALFALSPIVVVSLLAVYAFKSLLGIDLFPHTHLSDLFPFFLR